LAARDRAVAVEQRAGEAEHGAAAAGDLGDGAQRAGDRDGAQELDREAGGVPLLGRGERLERAGEQGRGRAAVLVVDVPGAAGQRAGDVRVGVAVTGVERLHRRAYSMADDDDAAGPWVKDALGMAIWIGSETVKQVPVPGRLWTSTEAPIIAHSSRVIARPRPAPS
jgi:hypothetical protein